MSLKQESNTIAEKNDFKRYDAVIIGGGPAGMSASLSLNERGIENIVLFEKEKYLGGVLPQCIHDGFGLVYYNKNFTGPEYAYIYEKKIKDSGIQVFLEASVTAIKKSADEKWPIEISVQKESGPETILAKAAIVSTGCRERSRGNIGISGSRPAGIYTAGTAQAFINLQNLMPARDVVIVGSGDIGLIMARRITLEGGNVKMVVEKEPVAGGLPRNVIQCLEDYNIPLLTNTVVEEIIGKNQVEAVKISKVDESGSIIENTSKIVECDGVVFSAGLIPEDEIIQDQEKGIFLCGNSLYVHELVDDVTLEGQMVAGKVEDYLLALEKGSELEPSKFSYPQINETRRKRREYLEEKRQKLINKKTDSKRTYTCIICPNSCEIDENLNGGMCSKGSNYVQQEILNPKRIFTSSVKITGGKVELASVKTSLPIPKEKIKEAAEQAMKLSFEAPITIGQVLKENFIEEGVSLIATRNIDNKAPKE